MRTIIITYKNDTTSWDVDQNCSLSDLNDELFNKWFSPKFGGFFLIRDDSEILLDLDKSLSDYDVKDMELFRKEDPKYVTVEAPYFANDSSLTQYSLNVSYPSVDLKLLLLEKAPELPNYEDFNLLRRNKVTGRVETFTQEELQDNDILVYCPVGSEALFNRNENRFIPSQAIIKRMYCDSPLNYIELSFMQSMESMTLQEIMETVPVDSQLWIEFEEEILKGNPLSIGLYLTYNNEYGYPEEPEVYKRDVSSPQINLTECIEGCFDGNLLVNQRYCLKIIDSLLGVILNEKTFRVGAIEVPKQPIVNDAVNSAVDNPVSPLQPLSPAKPSSFFIFAVMISLVVLAVA
jgi:hypothetical protein